MFCGHDPWAWSARSGTPLPPRRSQPLLPPGDPEWCATDWRNRRMSTIAASIGTEVVAALADACIRLADGDVREAGIDSARVPHCWVMFGAIGARRPAGARAAHHCRDLRRCRRRLPARGQHLFRGAGRRDGGAVPRLRPSGRRLGLARGRAAEHAPLGMEATVQRNHPQSRRPRSVCAAVRSSTSRRSPAIASILRQLQDHILLELRDHETAIPLLANDTLAHLPPLTFFRGLVLELDGAQRDSFDISDAVVSPHRRCRAVFAIAKRRLAPANTLARLEAALLDFPEGRGHTPRGGGRISHRALLSDAGGKLPHRPRQAGKIRPAAAQDRLFLHSALPGIHRVHFHSGPHDDRTIPGGIRGYLGRRHAGGAGTVRGAGHRDHGSRSAARQDHHHWGRGGARRRDAARRRVRSAAANSPTTTRP